MIYRLKSNRKTYVQPVRNSNGLYRVIWSKSMYSGYNSSWVISWQPEWNLIPLSEAKQKVIEKRIESFKKWFK